MLYWIGRLNWNDEPASPYLDYSVSEAISVDDGRVTIKVITMINTTPTIALIIGVVVNQTMIQLTSIETTAATLPLTGMHWL